MANIAALLESKAILDYSLISDKLSSILIEICQLLVDHGEEIEFLKKDLDRYTLKADLQKSLGDEHEQVTDLQNEVARLKSESDAAAASLADSLKVTEDRLTSQLTNLNESNMRSNDKQFKEIQGELFILNQQFKDWNQQSVSSGEKLAAVSKRVAAIEDAFEHGRKESLEVVALKVNSLEGIVQQFQSLEANHKSELDSAITQMKSQTKGDKDDSTREMREMKSELRELRRMITDAPAIECENGIADTEAIIRAIQRDSRRLDNFNEIIMTVRDEHNEMRDLFTILNAAVEKIQLNVVDFVNDANKTKTELISFSKETRQSTKENTQKVLKCSSDIGQVIDSTTAGMTLITNTLLQLFSFLSKITTRPLPVFGNFDDSLLEFQKVSDSVSALNEKYDDEQKTKDLTPQRDLDLDPTFQLPYVEIAKVSFPMPKGKPVAAQSSGDTQACVDLEMRQTLAALEAKIDRSVSEFSEFEATYVVRRENHSKSGSCSR